MNNELVSAPAQPVATVTVNRGYVSPLEKIGTYGELWEAGKMFAGSQLVPETFRNKPGDCAIALDLALRLNLNPLSLFPQLYVIHGRPSLSAQYMIALVNRSERFSCIRWEEGSDGEVEFTSYGKTRKIPNYYAVAYFTELSTGEQLKSTRIDVRLAHANGWLVKDGSKWQTMPQQMARYRSASWLIKSYAPELMMGLSFADEAEDIDDVETTPAVLKTVEIEEPKRRIQVFDVGALADRSLEDKGGFLDESTLAFEEAERGILEASTLAELQSVQVASEKLNPSQLAQLRKLYTTRKKELEPATTDDGSKKKRGRKPAQPATETAETETKTGAEILNELELGAAIQNASNAAEIEDLTAKVLDAYAAGNFDEKAKNKLIFALHDKQISVVGEPLPIQSGGDGATMYENILEQMNVSAEMKDFALLATQARMGDVLFVRGEINDSQRVEIANTYKRLTETR